VEQADTLQVLDVVSRRIGSVERGSTQQLFRSIHQDRLQPGAQYVALMGTGLLLQVVSGRISSRAGESLTGMTVAEAWRCLVSGHVSGRSEATDPSTELY
jgi:hypothetical protein